MNRRISIFLILTLILTVFVPGMAHADVERGSVGEEVAALQMMLFDMGWLFEEPDGQFGAKTEAAVKEYQQAAGLEPTGTVSDELMSKISQDWVDYQTWICEQMQLDAGEHIVQFCDTWEDEDGLIVTRHCRQHDLLWKNSLEMLTSGDAESALYSYSEWQLEIIRLYNEWISLSSAPVQAQIEVSKAMCLQLMQAQLDALRADHEEGDPTDVYYSAELWMKNHAVWLCGMLSTLNAQ